MFPNASNAANRTPSFSLFVANLIVEKTVEFSPNVDSAEMSCICPFTGNWVTLIATVEISSKFESREIDEMAVEIIFGSDSFNAFRMMLPAFPGDDWIKPRKAADRMTGLSLGRLK